MIEFDITGNQLAQLGLAVGDMLSTARGDWIVQEIHPTQNFTDSVWVVLRRINE